MALSSGEVELNSALKGAAELLGAKELMSEFGEDVSLRIEGDSAACQGIVAREGSGRIKHLQVRQLWIQGKIADGLLEYAKVPRESNTSDSLTKHWSTDGWRHFHTAGFYARDST